MSLYVAFLMLNRGPVCAWSGFAVSSILDTRIFNRYPTDQIGLSKLSNLQFSLLDILSTFCVRVLDAYTSMTPNTFAV